MISHAMFPVSGPFQTVCKQMCRRRSRGPHAPHMGRAFILDRKPGIWFKPFANRKRGTPFQTVWFVGCLAHILRYETHVQVDYTRYTSSSRTRFSRNFAHSGNALATSIFVRSYGFITGLRVAALGLGAWLGSFWDPCTPPGVAHAAAALCTRRHYSRLLHATCRNSKRQEVLNAEEF